MFSDDDFRLYSCARCLKLVRICSRCDRGNQYCSADCRVAGRRDCVRAARARYQRSPRGRERHSAGQRALRQRRRSAGLVPAQTRDQDVGPQMREPPRTAFQTAPGTRTALSLMDSRRRLPTGLPRRLTRPAPVEQSDQGEQRRHEVHCSLCDHACGPFARFGFLPVGRTRRSARTRFVGLVNPDPSRRVWRGQGIGSSYDRAPTEAGE